MRLIKEENSMWDSEKKAIFENIETGTFDLNEFKLGNRLGNEWWRIVNEDDDVLGFGWINYEDQDFEVSIAINSHSRGEGLGSFVLDKFEQIAKEKKYEQIVAIVKKTNPNSSMMIEWLYKKNYAYYFPELGGEIKKTAEFATSIVKKMDIHLKKNIEN